MGSYTGHDERKVVIIACSVASAIAFGLIVNWTYIFIVKRRAYKRREAAIAARSNNFELGEMSHRPDSRDGATQAQDSVLSHPISAYFGPNSHSSRRT